MTIKEVEAQTGITKANIRYYEKERLLTPKRDANNYRDYTKADVENLCKIKYLRLLGLSVSDIRHFIAGQKTLRQLLTERQEQIDREQKELAEVQRLCGQYADANWDFETFDYSLISMKREMLKRRGGEILKDDRISILRSAIKWGVRFCIFMLLITLLFPISQSLGFPIAVAKPLEDVCILICMLTPLPVLIAEALLAGRESRNKKEGLKGGVEKEAYSLEQKVQMLNKICLASMAIIFPLNFIFHINWPYWAIAIWIALIFGSTIWTLIIKNR